MNILRRPRESGDPVPSSASRRVPAFAGTTERQRGGAVLRLLLVLLVLALIGCTLVVLDYRKFTETPLTIARPDATIDVARGETYRTIVDHLRGAGFTQASPWYWRAFGRELGIEGRLHAGEYALTQGLTPRELLQKMADGEVLQHHFTIVDGWTFRQLRVALAADAGLVQTVTTMSDQDLAHKLGIEDGHRRCRASSRGLRRTCPAPSAQGPHRPRARAAAAGTSSRRRS